MSSGNIAADQLRQFIERVERLEEEKKSIADGVKDVYAEAKSNGYDVKTMRAIVRLRKMDKNARLEAEALLETYKAALGMDDMFTGHDGRSASSRPVSTIPPKDDGEQGVQPKDEPVQPPPPPYWADDDHEGAAKRGKLAGTSGQPITANPYPAKDKRRAIWDDAWCKATGSDGMDIPAHLKPGAKPKDDKPKEDKKA